MIPKTTPSFKVYQAYIGDEGQYVLLIRDYVMNPHRIRGWLLSYQYVLRFKNENGEPTEEQIRKAVEEKRLERKAQLTAAQKFHRDYTDREFQ